MKPARLTFLVIAALAYAAWVLASGGYNIPRNVTGSGGRYTTAGNYVVGNTTGQVVAGHVASGNYQLYAGFWGPQFRSGPTTVYLPLTMRGYSPLVEIPDAPQTCPGYPVVIGTRYREDLDRANDNDWYSFEAEAGQTYAVQTFDLQARIDTILALYDQDCSTLLAENDDRELGSVSSLIVWTAPATGQYHVLARGYDWAIYGAETGYSFQVTRQLPGATSNQP